METLTIRRVALDTLHADPANARLHGERNMEAISASLQRFGQAEPLVVQRSTQRVIGGNGRLVAMRALGWTECDVVNVDLDDGHATALAIALNRTGELAEWDNTALARLLESLKADGALDAAGYTDDEMQEVLDELLRDSAIEVNQDDVPAQPDAATSKRGDVWIIGRHRLMCCDSSIADDVATLLAGAPIHLLNTDPVYNVTWPVRGDSLAHVGLSGGIPLSVGHGFGSRSVYESVRESAKWQHGAIGPQPSLSAVSSAHTRDERVHKLNPSGGNLMALYVDGYLIPIPKKKISAYKRMATTASKVWRKHGALDYRECIGDDLKIKGVTSFLKSAKAKSGETVIFAWVLYKSRAHRDRVNTKVMKDPKMLAMMASMKKDPKKVPFDMRRMAFSGFKVFVEA